MKDPTILNKELTDANNEYQVSIPDHVKSITIQCRSDHDVRMAFVTGKVADSIAPYFTIKKGTSYWETNIQYAGSIFFASAQAGAVVEIIHNSN